MREYDSWTRREAVKHYMTGSTLERTAVRFEVHRNTVWRWVTIFKRGGRGAFETDVPLHRHGKRLSEGSEEAVIALKESQPGITVRRAQELLGERQIKVSPKGIWSIWQRHGLTGFAR
jgi:transposase